MLFEPLQSRSLDTKNRLVMSPMTRNRAVAANPRRGRH
jgi:2,4-dienoyl-CoA reductase-like NADH-dependent reductase (Old Yellow Enzyme family)